MHLLIFHNELVAQQIIVYIFFVEHKVIRRGVVLIVFESAETFSNDTVDYW